MKLFTALATAVLITAPGLAQATYICDKMFAEKHQISCPAGSVYDTHYHARISTGS